MNRTEIGRLLPAVFQRTIGTTTPLDALLEVMEDLQAPSEEVLAGLDRYFDPRRAPDPFVPFLARWVDLERALLQPAPHYYRPGSAEAPLQSGMGRLRELVASAAYLSMWRGTVTGILRFLEVATGLGGFAVDEHVPGRPFHVRFTGPKEAAPYAAMVNRIIDMEKPAYVTFELALAGAQQGG
ncbi:MAG TPA: phage tail protein [Candidatus Dormibacteraeota bacterium]|nr:phage tail protein [Candidatus Dormibacteraeota bacterium]